MTHKWNWQQKDWPDFTYKIEDLRGFEEQVLTGTGLLSGSLQHLDEQETNHLRAEIITDEALKTSEIEGEYLNRDSLQSSILSHFGLKTNSKKIPPAEKGIAEMMMNLYKDFSSPITHLLLYKWNEMVMKGRTDLKNKGLYRKSKNPMRVVSGPLHKPDVHFEAPPSGQVQSEMKNFIKWFNNSSPEGSDPLPAITRAGIAHLYFVSIHPFEDGNGRIGRAIAEKALAQCLGKPTLIALSRFIQENGKDYYDSLEKANKNNQITQWLVYFGKTITGAQKHSQQLVNFLIRKTKMFDSLNNKLNKRQKKVLLRMFKEGPDGFKGGLSAGNYQIIAKTTRQTATRDLNNLVEKSALTRKGERKYARYYLNLNM